MTELDPITERVLANAFVAICNEMGITMIRTANSAVFVDGRDFSCALLDDRAELVATANFDPSHLSAMALTSEYALMELGFEDLAEGDVILVNDPYRGGGHLTDITLIRPVFYAGALLGVAMNRAHHIDVGGMAVAGFPGSAQSIFQEGLRIPPVKWYRAGVEQRDVMELITLNVRFPQDQLGDFRAQLASTITAERRLQGLCEKYGPGVVRAAMERVKDHSETLMRSIIAEIPDGRYEFDELMDDDGVGSEPYRIHVAVTVADDAVEVDFTGTSAQAKGPINSSYGNTLSGTFNAFLQLIGPDLAFNHGCFRPVRLIVPRGCFLNPLPPAPVFGGVTEVSIRIIDAIIGALAQAVPGWVAAAGYGTCQNFAGGGFDDTADEDIGFYFFREGGWGATAWRDGWNATPNQTSNFNDYPVETVERDLPLRYQELALRAGSGGAGRFRGGFGVVRTMEILASEVRVNALSERHVVKPYGLDGGLPGEPNALLLKPPGETQFQRFDECFSLASPSKFANVPLARGTSVALVTGGGGGYGDPLERDPEAVRFDVEEELVSVAQARDVYGVVLRGAHPDYDVDGPATETRRQQLRSERGPLDQVAGIVNVDGTWRRAVAGARPATLDDPKLGRDLARLSQTLRAVDRQFDIRICREDCPKHADPARCPYHNGRALDFWAPESLRGWTLRHCLYDPDLTVECSE